MSLISALIDVELINASSTDTNPRTTTRRLLFDSSKRGRLSDIMRTIEHRRPRFDDRLIAQNGYSLGSHSLYQDTSIFKLHLS